jgi:hypothetical protein
MKGGIGEFRSRKFGTQAPPTVSSAWGKITAIQGALGLQQSFVRCHKMLVLGGICTEKGLLVVTIRGSEEEEEEVAGWRN